MSAKLPHGALPLVGLLVIVFALACDANPYDPPEIRQARQLVALPLDTPFVVGTSVEARVRATDIRVQPVAGVVVHWNALNGIGAVSPASSVTDPDGIARVTWTFDTLAVTYQLSATSDTLTPAEFTVSPRAGAAVSLRISADSVRLPEPGDAITLSAQAADRYHNAVVTGIVWGTLDPLVATVDASGRVSATGTGSTRVHARSGTMADTVRVDVGPYPGTGAALAYALAGQTGAQLVTVDTTTNAAHVVRLLPNEEAGALDVAPDGDYVAYVTAAWAAGPHVDVLDLRRREVVRLTTGTGPATGPVAVGWSPSGSRVAWLLDRTLALAARDGTAHRTITTRATDVSWTASGALLYVTDRIELWLLTSADATSPTRVRVDTAAIPPLRSVRAAHDMTRILLVGDAGELLVAEAPASATEDWTVTDVSPAVGVSAAEWLPDGTIVYATGASFGNVTLHRIAADGTGTTALAPDPIVAWQVSGDGTVLYADIAGLWRLRPGSERVAVSAAAPRVLGWAR